MPLVGQIVQPVIPRGDLFEKRRELMKAWSDSIIGILGLLVVRGAVILWALDGLIAVTILIDHLRLSSRSQTASLSPHQPQPLW